MKQIVRTNTFKKDLKRLKKQGKKLDRLWAVLEKLIKGETLEPKHKPHRLSGEWSDWWECHIEPDWLLIYDYSDTELILVRSGSHSDLF